MRFACIIVLAGLAAADALAAEIPQDERRSGYSFMTPDTRTMQDDGTANPGMLWVLDGEKLWNRKAGAADKACADCHNDARASMKGVAAHYPAFDKVLGRPVDLEGRINLCRANHQQATPLGYESRDLLALTAFCRTAIARCGDRNRQRPGASTVHRQGPRSLHAAAGPAQSRLRQLP
jgi:sulfur-oxidizing protein SoxA